MFDWKYYLDHNKDLHNEGITTQQLALRHFNNHGREQGLICCPIPKHFDWKFYTTYYKDLSQIANEIIAYEHYFYHGEKEGRIVNEEHKTFDWKFYTTFYKDLSDITNRTDAYGHYLNHGSREKRFISKENMAKAKAAAEAKATAAAEAKAAADAKAKAAADAKAKAAAEAKVKAAADAKVKAAAEAKVKAAAESKAKAAAEAKVKAAAEAADAKCKISKPKFLINTNSILGLTGGDTIFILNLIKDYAKEYDIILLSEHSISNNFMNNIDNNLNSSIEKIEKIEKIPKNKLVEHIDKHEKLYKYIFIRNHEILDQFVGKSYLTKTIIYGLNQHVQDVQKLDNKFLRLMTQSEQLKKVFKDAGVQENKIEIREPKAFNYNFDLPERNDNEIRLIYCGTLRDEENILEIIEEFEQIHAERPEVVLKIVYGKIHGNEEFREKVNKFIKEGVNGITFKHNLCHRDACYEIATSDIGICWRKNGWGDNGEVSTKVKEYELYGLMIINEYLMNLKNINISIFSTASHILDGSSLFTKIYNKYISNLSVGYRCDDYDKSLYHHYKYDIIIPPKDKNKQNLFIKFIIILSTLKDIYVMQRGYPIKENNFFHQIAFYSKIFYQYDIHHLITPDTFSEYNKKIKNINIVHQNSKENHDKFKTIYPAFYKYDYVNTKPQQSNKDIVIGVFGSITSYCHYNLLIDILIKIAKKNKSIKIIFIYGKINRRMNSKTLHNNLKILKSLPNVELLHNIPHDKMKLYYDKINLGIFTKQKHEDLESVECHQISSRFIDYIYNNVPFIFYNHNNAEKEWIDEKYPLSINEITYEIIMDKIMYYKNNNVVLKDYIKSGFYYTYSIDNMIDTFKH